MKYLKKLTESTILWPNGCKDPKSDFEDIMDNYIDGLEQTIRYDLITFPLSKRIEVRIHFDSSLAMDPLLSDLCDYVNGKFHLDLVLKKILPADLIKRIYKLTSFRLCGIYRSLKKYSQSHNESVVLDFTSSNKLNENISLNIDRDLIKDIFDDYLDDVDGIKYSLSKKLDIENCNSFDILLISTKSYFPTKDLFSEIEIYYSDNEIVDRAGKMRHENIKSKEIFIEQNLYNLDIVKRIYKLTNYKLSYFDRFMNRIILVFEKTHQ